jgi:DNA-binding NarL/FixJ family response regulator
VSREPEAFASVVRGGEALAAAELRLRRDAWVTRRGWELPDEPWSHRLTKVVCLGAVVDAASAEAALVACARSAGVVADVGECPEDLLGPFLDDLSRLALAPVPGRGQAPAALPLTPEQRALLELVARGASVPEAAEALFLSHRTAERRMAGIRKALGVPSTAAAVALLRRDGGLSGKRS